MGVWTSWQAIALDIESNHLFPAVWQGRLFLFWAIFTQEAEEPSAAELKQAQATPAPPTKFWRLKLAWSEFKSGVWTSRRLAQDVSSTRLSTAIYAYDPTWFFSSISVKGEGVTIRVYHENKSFTDYAPFTTLFFDGHSVRRAGGSDVYVPKSRSYRFDQSPSDAADAPVDGSAPERILGHWKMNIEKSSAQDIDLNPWGIAPIQMFSAIPRSAKLLYSPEITSALFAAPYFFSTLPIAQTSKAAPFFVSDRLHQFFCYPTRQLRVRWLVENVSTPPSMMIDEIPSLHF